MISSVGTAERSSSICDGCVFYFPERRRRCSCLPRAVPEDMAGGCACRLEVPEDALAMRAVLPDDGKNRKERGQ